MLYCLIEKINTELET